MSLFGFGTTASTWTNSSGWLTSTGTASTWTNSSGWLTSAGATTTTGATSYTNYITTSDSDVLLTQSGPIRIQDGHAAQIKLPDGTVIDVKADGSYTIEDKDAKVIYRANRMRDFNPFINVSDRLEEFIEFCGKQGVRQSEMMELPLNLFIGWLVLQAAKADHEPEPQVPLLPDLRKRITPRCPGCGRFTLSDMRAKKIEFCAPACFERHYQRHVKALPAPDRTISAIPTKSLQDAFSWTGRGHPAGNSENPPQSALNQK